MLLCLALSVAGQDASPQTVAPRAPGDQSGQAARASRDPKVIAKTEKALAEARRYKGTTAVADRKLRADDKLVKQACQLLSKADFVPELRLRRYALLDPDLLLVGWRVTIEMLQVRPSDALVQVRVAPLLWSPDGGKIGVFSFYHEEYRIARGKLQFVRGEPLPEDLSINFAVQ